MPINLCRDKVDHHKLLALSYKFFDWVFSDGQTNWLTERQIDRPTDRAVHRFACTRLKKKEKKDKGKNFSNLLRWFFLPELKGNSGRVRATPLWCSQIFPSVSFLCGWRPNLWQNLVWFCRIDNPLWSRLLCAWLGDAAWPKGGKWFMLDNANCFQLWAHVFIRKCFRFG